LSFGKNDSFWTKKQLKSGFPFVEGKIKNGKRSGEKKSTGTSHIGRGLRIGKKGKTKILWEPCKELEKGKK